MPDNVVEKTRKRLVLPEDGDPIMRFFTHTGIHAATGYTRIVIGERGAYVEFSRDQVVAASLRIPEDQRWRVSEETRGRAYYIEHRAGAVKVYEQLRGVDYADYHPGYFYVAPADLVSDAHPVLILPPENRQAKETQGVLF